MKSKQKISFLPWLYSSKVGKDGRAPLYIRITIENDQKDVSVERKILPEHWDVESKCDKSGTIAAKEINAKIAQMLGDLDTHGKIMKAQHSHVTSQMVKSSFLGKPEQGEKKPEKHFLLAEFQIYIDLLQKQVDKDLRDDGYLRHAKSSKRKLQSFIKWKFRKDDLLLSDVKFAFGEDYFHFLTLEIEKPVGEVTAKNHLKKLSTVLKRCVRKELIPANPIEGYFIEAESPEVEPLELSQVEAIYQKHFSIPRLEEIKDAYIFQCFTGFAFQDIEALGDEHIIKVGRDGEEWLMKHRGKTKVMEMVPLLPIVKELIAKYRNHPYCIETGKLMPIKSNQKYNGYLKEIADLCGINRELNTHLARHTFADIMLNNGAALEEVQRMLGHKSIRTTQKYARVRKERLSQTMAKVKTTLFSEDGKLRKIA